MIWLVKKLMWLLGRLPEKAPYLIANRCAGVWMRLSPGKRKTAQANLNACFPLLAAEQFDRILKQSFTHYISSILETGRNWNWSVDRLQSLCIGIEGEDLLNRSLASGRGVMVLAPHFGAWEYLGIYLQKLINLAILYKPAAHPGLEEALLHSRQRSGGLVLPTTASGLRQLFAHLRAGKNAGLLPDQQATDGQGVFAPFFGVAALTGVLAPRLAQKTDCVVLFVVSERLTNGHYRIHVLPADDDIYSTDLEVAVAAVNRGVEKCIEIDPTQYLWSYKRFRTRPAGEPPLYS